jgi:hypothetical protein
MGETENGTIGPCDMTLDGLGTKHLASSNPFISVTPFYTPLNLPGSDPKPAGTLLGSTVCLRFEFSAAPFNGPYLTGPLLSNATNNFGLELWVNPAATAANACLAYNGNTASNGWGIFQVGNTVQGLFGGVGFFGSGALPLDTWTHIALVRQGGVATLYVNGVAAGTTAAAPLAPSGGFAIGASPPAFTAGFIQDATIDELRYFTFIAGQFSTNDLLLHVPDIAVEQPAGTALADGASRNFGTVTLGENATLTFSLHNAGGADLLLTGTPKVAITGVHAADFSVTTQPVSPVLSSAAIALTNAGFETPAFAANGWSYAPGGADWTFGATAGIARNGSP